MNEEFFSNVGPLFAQEKLADLPSLPEWNCDEGVAAAHLALRETFEKHLETLRGDATEPQTKFFVVNPVLHALGFVYSIQEPIPLHGDAQIRVDYSLFEDSVTFADAEPMRATTSFFRTVVGLCQASSWGDGLALADDPEVAAQQPMVLMDVFLRSSGVDYGLVTNGKEWRLIHRGTSDRFNTYFAVDIEKLMEGDMEQFKYFYLLFGAASLVRTDEGTRFLDRFLADY